MSAAPQTQAATSGMESPWDLNHYLPTYDDTSRYDVGYWTRPTSARVAGLALDLQMYSRALKQSPRGYHLLYARSVVLQELGYPELAVHDACNGLLLVNIAHESVDYVCPDARALAEVTMNIRAQLVSALRAAKCFSDAIDVAKGNGKFIRYAPGFDVFLGLPGYQDQLWMLEDLQKQKCCYANSCYFSSYAEYRLYLLNGSIKVQPYPWMHEDVLDRPQSLLDLLQVDLQYISSNLCSLEESELAVTSAYQKPVLEIVALKDISAGTVVFNNQAKRSSIPPGMTYDPVEDIMAPSRRGYVGVLYEILYEILRHLITTGGSLASVATSAIGLLRHPRAQSLAANYGKQTVPFCLEDDSIAPVRILEFLGMDPFADADTSWVVQTIRHRLTNNIFGISATPDGQWAAKALFPSFVHLNHSCCPNTDISECSAECFCLAGMQLIAIKDILEGESLTMSYNPGVMNLPVEERQAWLWQQLGGSCHCSRCEEETRERRGLYV